MTKQIVLLFTRGSSPRFGAIGLPPLTSTYTGTKCAREARRKWWAQQDLNLGPIDYEDPRDLAPITLRRRFASPFFWTLIFDLKQSEPIPNRPALWQRFKGRNFKSYQQFSQPKTENRKPKTEIVPAVTNYRMGVCSGRA